MPHAVCPSSPGFNVVVGQGVDQGGLHGILEIGDVSHGARDWWVAPLSLGKAPGKASFLPSLPCVQAAAANFWQGRQGLLYSTLQARLGAAKQPSLGRNCLNWRTGGLTDGLTGSLSGRYLLRSCTAVAVGATIDTIEFVRLLLPP